MPINKKAFIRYQALDLCFSNFGRKYYWQDLLDVVNEVLKDSQGVQYGIGRTQLFKDISFMESEQGFSIPLLKEKDGRRVYYRYNSKDFSITNNPLSHSEMTNFKSAIEVLSRFKGLPQFEWISEILPVINDRMGLVNDSKQVILFDSNLDYTGVKYIEPIFQAISNNRVLKIEYQDFKHPSSYSIILHPYILKQYNNRWFVLGLNESKFIATWIMALDRIQDIKELESKYIVSDVDWEDDYFYDIIGVSRNDGDVIEIELEFDQNLAPYILTKPIHPTQSKVFLQENGNVRICIKVIPNYELERLILSFGEQVSVVRPLEFKGRIRERVFRLGNIYK